MTSHRLTYSIFLYSFFFFNDTATTEIYTLSLHDALPILGEQFIEGDRGAHAGHRLHKILDHAVGLGMIDVRSEEHTSELQSQSNLVCRLLLEKKKKKKTPKSKTQYAT